MHPPLVVVIRENPTKSHRAVEALRIALGLSAGESPVTVVLLDQAPYLLTRDIEDIVDGETLEKHLPALKESEIQFIVLRGIKASFKLDQSIKVQEVLEQEASALIRGSDRVLVF